MYKRQQQRWNLFRSFAPILTLLFFANLFLTVLQDVKEDFLVKIIDVNAAGLSDVYKRQKEDIGLAEKSTRKELKTKFCR